MKYTFLEADLHYIYLRLENLLFIKNFTVYMFSHIPTNIKILDSEKPEKPTSCFLKTSKVTEI